jgi:hypothetical protein
MSWNTASMPEDSFVLRGSPESLVNRMLATPGI